MTGDLTYDGTFDAVNSQLDYDVCGDTVFADMITLAQTIFDLDGNGKLDMKNVILTDVNDQGSTSGKGSFTASVKDDITFGIIEAKENDLTLESRKGNIASYEKDGYIRFTDSDKTYDESLTLSAGSALLDQMVPSDNVGNIGAKDHKLIVDTDDVLNIPAINNYYIDSVELVGDELFEGKRPVLNIQTGTDEFGNFVEGDYLESSAGTETVYAALKTQLGTDIAAMLTGRMEREAWSKMIDDSVLAALIKAKTITSKEMVKLLGQTDSTMTSAEIKVLLKQGDAIKNGETLSGYEQLAQALEAQLGSKNADDEMIFSDELLESWLAEGITISKVNIDELTDALSMKLTNEEIEELLKQALAKANYEAWKSTQPEDAAPRGIIIEVGEATGRTYVTNEGDIVITQQKGTLTAGAVLSDRGSVTLTAQGSGIEGTEGEEMNILAKDINMTAKDGVGADTKVLVEQRDNRPTLVANVINPVKNDDGNYDGVNVDALDAQGNPTTEVESEERPEEEFALETLVKFDWLRVEYLEDAMQLNITAGGDVNVEEISGDMGLGVIETENGDVALTAARDVLDTRDEGESKGNIIVGNGDVQINAENGVIGAEDDRIETDVDGTITARTEGDVNIADTGTLDLIADSEKGQVNASAAKDLNLKNTVGDLVVGPIEAGDDVTIIAKESIVAGDRHGRDAQVKGNSISMTAQHGQIGTSEDAFLVDTDADRFGTLYAKGNYLNIEEISGDAIVEGFISETDGILTTPDDILDGRSNAIDKAVQAQKEANQAQADADKAEAEAFVQTEEYKNSQAALEKAENERDEALSDSIRADEIVSELTDALDAAEQELNGLIPGTKDYKAKAEEVEKLKAELEKAKTDADALRKEYEEAEKAYQEAEANNNKQQAEAEAAQNAFAQAKAEAEAKQSAAEAAAQAVRDQMIYADEQAKAQQAADQAKDEAEQAQKAADEAAREAEKAQEALDRAENAKDEAYSNTVEGITEAIEKAEQELGKLTEGTEEYEAKAEEIKELKAELTKAEQSESERSEAYEAAKDAYDAALEQYNKEQAEADNAQNMADEKLAEAVRLQQIAENDDRLADEAQQEADAADAAADQAEAEAAQKAETADQSKAELDDAQDALDEAYANTAEGITEAIESAKEELAKLDPQSEAYKAKAEEIKELKEALRNAEESGSDAAYQEALKNYEEALAKYEKDQAEADAAQQKAEDERAEADRLQDIADALDSSEKVLKDLADVAEKAEQEAEKAENEADQAETEAAEKADIANQSKNELDKAQTELDEAYADTAEGITEAIESAKEELAKLEPESEAYKVKVEEIKELEEKLENAKESALDEDYQKALEDYEEALAKYEKDQADADAAQQIAEEKRAEADEKRDIAADAALDAQKPGSNVITGGDLTLNAGGSIGEAGDGLNVQVGGVIDANSDENVMINGSGDLTFSDVKVEGDVKINTIDGSIKDNGGVIESDKLDVNAMNGNVGEKNNPLTAMTNKIDATGTNVYIENLKDTTIGNITAEEELVLDSKGDVTGAEGNEPNVSAGDATINADGNIGSEDNRLDTNVDNFHGTADDIYIDNHSPNIDISGVNADRLDVKTDGNVTGEDNTVHDIIIDADGYVGRPGDPFEFWADGIVKIHGGLGAWWLNHYREFAEKQTHIAAQRFAAMLVLDYEITIGGKTFTVYVLIGVTESGRLNLIGFFLCEGEASEAFWMSVLRYLRNNLLIGEIGLIIHEDEGAIRIPAITVYDGVNVLDFATLNTDEARSDRAMDVLDDLTKTPEAMLDELTAFDAGVRKLLMQTFESEQELIAALQQYGREFTKQSDAWID